MFFNYWGEVFVTAAIIISAIYIIYKRIKNNSNQCSSCGSCSKMCPRYKNSKDKDE
jgi:dissimilatory sulfite reductase (desulfoviridin) alpha/beta subunit